MFSKIIAWSLDKHKKIHIPVYLIKIRFLLHSSETFDMFKVLLHLWNYNSLKVSAFKGTRIGLLQICPGRLLVS